VGVVVRNGLRPLIRDLDSLPFPYRRLWVDVSESEFQYYLLMVSRGCPFSCSYCFNSTYHGLYRGENITRFRSVESVVAELESAKAQFGLKWVLPIDDNLLLNPDWLRKFAHEYKKRVGVPYCATTHPLTIDFERAKLLKDSGCKFVKIGIQSGSERVRKYAMNRLETNKNLLDAAYACRKAGLRFTLDHIFGVDDGIEALNSSIVLYNCARPVQINSFQLYIFPSTPIIEYLKLNSEDVGKVNLGLYQDGSIKSHHNLPYRNFMTLLPLLPQRMVSYVFKSSFWLGVFTKVPEPLLQFAKIVTNIRLRNTPALMVNLKFLPHKLRLRLRGYKGDFD
jgi:radical SAM superfamily enzyme YgiQ (UPF0313 family)